MRIRCSVVIRAASRLWISIITISTTTTIITIVIVFTGIVWWCVIRDVVGAVTIVLILSVRPIRPVSSGQVFTPCTEPQKPTASEHHFSGTLPPQHYVPQPLLLPIV